MKELISSDELVPIFNLTESYVIYVHRDSMKEDNMDVNDPMCVCVQIDFVNPLRWYIYKLGVVIGTQPMEWIEPEARNYFERKIAKCFSDEKVVEMMIEFSEKTELYNKGKLQQ